MSSLNARRWPRAAGPDGRPGRTEWTSGELTEELLDPNRRKHRIALAEVWSLPRSADPNARPRRKEPADPRGELRSGGAARRVDEHVALPRDAQPTGGLD